MRKLHELLAVEGSLENQANACRTGLLDTFEKKGHLFAEKRVTFQPLAEDGHATTDIQSEIQTTLPKELAWLAQHVIKALDASLQVAEANTRAVADIILEDGTLVARAVPATALLELEKRAAELVALTKAIPKMDATKGFKKDESRPDTQIAREVVKQRTKKVKKVVVLYEATKEHPAQTQLHDTDEVVGTLHELEWSSLITAADKSELVNRAEMVQRAIRQARSRANDVEVNPGVHIGAALWAAIFG